ncbi:NAD(P)H-dependent oxidoreductase subunit E [Candidatus Comchoanobacter bicostacola]|uniref:NADH-quinone oxidoreductase subunit E n=1 Tax=Candidatus Comchoanobacter bicostacola TaxID=2919598 RepID=A0ABY5DM75_9GAMM|nr:NAD(P)H-dependent oxidoreductase subunit E [Candidatus Comchoanobacter bicostacola]UTC24787.1 NAD(P)H-dependent oxidoreductase subunit E [Candidatus Comchoanobacter bicostacola]
MIELDAQDKKVIDRLADKFPKGKQASSILMALNHLQNRYGWLSDEHLDAVAAYLEMPAARVYEVVSFYSLYKRAPDAPVNLKVCTSLSCCLNGAQGVKHYLESLVNDLPGQDASQLAFSVGEAECLGACDGAPVVIVNDADYHRNVTKESLQALIKEYRSSPGKHND